SARQSTRRNGHVPAGVAPSPSTLDDTTPLRPRAHEKVRSPNLKMPRLPPGASGATWIVSVADASGHCTFPPRKGSSTLLSAMTIEAPFSRFTDRVRPEWVDYNGHLNVAYYFLIFDKATDAFYDWLGIGKSYKDSSHFSTCTLEGHITYDRELLEGDPVYVTSRLLDFDGKRLHYFH